MDQKLHLEDAGGLDKTKNAMELLGACARAGVAGICCGSEGFLWEGVTGICTIVIAIGAVVSAWWAIIAVRVQERRARFATGLDAILRLDGLWCSERIKEARVLTAGQILAKEKPSKAIEDVLDFFDTLGLFVRKEGISVELAWSFFYYWLDGYATVARDYINGYRRKEPTVWEDLVWLHDQVRSFEQQRTKCTEEDLNLTPEEIEEFLREEAGS